MRELRFLPSHELVKELADRRERLKTFLRSLGVDCDGGGHSVVAANSALLENLSISSINALDKNIATVYMAASELRTLFEVFPETATRQNLRVTYGAHEKSASAKEVYNLLVAGGIKENERIAAPVAHLRRIAAESVKRTSDQGKTVAPSGLESKQPAAATTQPAAIKPSTPIMPATQPSSQPSPETRLEPVPTSKGLSNQVAISQDELNALFAPGNQDAEPTKVMPQTAPALSPATSPKTAGPTPTIIDTGDSAAVGEVVSPYSTLVSQAPATSAAEQKNAPVNQQGSGQDDLNLSQEELDKLFAASTEAAPPAVQPIPQAAPATLQAQTPPQNKVPAKDFGTNVSQEELDLLFSSSPKKTEQPTAKAAVPITKSATVTTSTAAPNTAALKPAKDYGPNVSQDELDNLFNVKTPVKAPEPTTTNIEALKPKTDIINQPAPSKDSVAPSPTIDSKAAISQNDIDNLFGTPSTNTAKPAPATDSDANISQDDINKMFGAQPAKAPEPSQSADIQQDDIDKLFSAPLQSNDVQQSEIDKLFSAKPVQPEADLDKPLGDSATKAAADTPKAATEEDELALFFKARAAQVQEEKAAAPAKPATPGDPASTPKKVQEFVLLNKLDAESITGIGPDIKTIYSTAEALKELVAAFPKSREVKSLQVVYGDDTKKPVSAMLEMLESKKLDPDEAITIEAPKLMKAVA